MPNSIVKNFRDGQLVLKDGSGTPIAVTIQFESGDFSISGLSANSNTEVTTYLDRGSLGSVRLTNQSFPTWSFSAHMVEFSDSVEKTLWDAVHKSAGTPWASAVSTITNSDVYGLDCVINIEGTSLGEATDHTLTLVGNRITLDFAEGDPNSFTVNGTCYGTITAT